MVVAALGVTHVGGVSVCVTHILASRALLRCVHAVGVRLSATPFACVFTPACRRHGSARVWVSVQYVTLAGVVAMLVL